jgi:hypothetical protein
MLQDLRYSARTLLKTPGFTAVAILTLALGMGANTAIFSAVNAVLLRSLPYAEPDRLVFVAELLGGGPMPTSYPNFLDWRAQQSVFEKLAAYGADDFNLTGLERAERVSGELVSDDYFELLGVPAIKGRTFLPEENSKPGASPVADPDLPVYSVSTLENRLRDQAAETRSYLLLIGLFALLALVLSAIGIYGVTAFTVTQRTHEIGVRVALGAEGGDVLRLVIIQVMRLTVTGVAIGLAAAFALTRLMASLVFKVSVTDPPTFAAISLLLATVALLACYIPARRTTNVDPMVALRYE